MGVQNESEHSVKLAPEQTYNSRFHSGWHLKLKIPGIFDYLITWQEIVQTFKLYNFYCLIFLSIPFPEINSAFPWLFEQFEKICKQTNNYKCISKM